jgi:hypothetical protein
MINAFSMFGVKIHPHRSLIILGIISCSVFIFLLISNKKPVINEPPLVIDNDEDINLIDLFNIGFKLIYQAGESIKLIKNTKENFGKIFKKNSFKNLESEPVTIADLISHSIITNGLKNKFKNLKVFSDFIFNNLFVFFKDYFRRKRSN